MKSTLRLFGFVMLAALATTAVRGQETPSEPPVVQEPVRKPKKLRLVPLPAIFYTPETRLGLGAVVMGAFKLGQDTITRTSSAQSVLAYTLNKQIIFENTYNVFTPGEKYVLNGEISFYDYPIYYYGIGNNTPEIDEENDEQKKLIDITYKLLYIHNRAVRRLSGSWFAGLQQRVTHVTDLEWHPNSLILTRPEDELNGYLSSGVGPVLIKDSRNSAINASTGFYGELSSLHHIGAFGSEHRFNRYFLDLRKYITLRKSTVLALQGLGNFSDGEVPFREMGLLGGQNTMRGYFRGRYRDKQYAAAQAEVRQHIYGPVGVVLFGGLGDVAGSLDSFDAGQFKWTAGGGLRVMVNKNDRVNIRIDYGIGKNTSGFYFGIAEAF